MACACLNPGGMAPAPLVSAAVPALTHRETKLRVRDGGLDLLRRRRDHLGVERDRTANSRTIAPAAAMSPIPSKRKGMVVTVPTSDNTTPTRARKAGTRAVGERVALEISAAATKNIPTAATARYANEPNTPNTTAAASINAPMTANTSVDMETDVTATVCSQAASLSSDLPLGAWSAMSWLAARSAVCC